jgi:hypothetical protein
MYAYPEQQIDVLLHCWGFLRNTQTNKKVKLMNCYSSHNSAFSYTLI